LRILLAEDNLVNQMLATRLLRNRGYLVEVAGNGRDALSMLQKEGYDLVFMDVQMPEMDGLEATAVIREQERKSGEGYTVPIIALTAHAMKGDEERFLDAILRKYLMPRAEAVSTDAAEKDDERHVVS
jgi:CheY-like chemotaxis protein